MSTNNNTLVAKRKSNETDPTLLNSPKKPCTPEQNILLEDHTCCQVIENSYITKYASNVAEGTSLEDRIQAAEMITALFIAEHNVDVKLVNDLIPFFVRLTSLDPEAVQHMKVKGKKCCATIKNVLYEYEISKISSILRSTFFSILIDETTMFNKIIYCISAQYAELKSRRTIQHLLLLIERNPKNPNECDNVVSCFKEFVQKHNIDPKNIVALACGGNSPALVSFQKFLKELNPCVMILNFICPSSDFVGTFDMIPETVEKILKNTCPYFSNNLQSFGELRDYLMFLQDETGRETIYLNDSVKGYAYFIKHCSSFYDSLSKLHQSKGSVIHKLFEAVEQNLKQLGMSFLTAKALQHVADTDFEITDETILPLEKTNFGFDCSEIQKSTTENVKDFQMNCLNFYLGTIQEVRNRFIDHRDFLKQLAFLEPQVALSKTRQDFTDSDLKNFCDRYFPYIDSTSLTAEWKCLPYLFDDEGKDKLLKMDVETFWNYVFQLERGLNFPFLKKLMEAIFSIPHSNAEIERTFADMNEIKNSKAHAIGIKLLNARCFLKSFGTAYSVSELNFNPSEEHFNLFNSANMYLDKK